MDATTPDAPRQLERNQFLIEDVDRLRQTIAMCPHAQTLTGYSPSLHAEVIIALSCKQWSCRFCSENKIRRLSALTRDAKPNRLLTLTVDPKLWNEPRDAFDGTRGRKVQSTGGGRVTELTARGWPHYHFLLRSQFLPQKVVKDTWAGLTGATIVDLRQVRQSFRAYNYLVKYLSKLHKIEWTERHVSYSKSFFQEPVNPKNEKMDLMETLIVEQHPFNYMREYLHQAMITQVGNSLFTVDPTYRAPETFPDANPHPCN